MTGHFKAINAVSIRQQRPLRAATVSDDSSMCFLHGAPFKFNSKADGPHKAFVLGTAFSPDGSRLVTVGADKVIQLYDGKTGEPTGTIGDGEHTGSIFSVSWSQDGSKLVTASADQTVRLWDVESGKNIQSWRLGLEGGSVRDQQVGVVYVHGRTDGLIISLNLDGDLTYLHEGSDKPSRIVQGHNKSITALGAGSAGGSALWTGSFDGRVCRWDLEKGVATAVDSQSHSNQVVNFASGAGRTYSAGWDDMLHTIDETSSKYEGPAAKLPAQPKGIATSNGRVYVATATGVAVFENGKLLGETPLSFIPTAIAAHNSLVAVAADQRVLILESDSAGSLSETRALTGSTAQVSSLSFSLDGAHLAAGNAVGKILVYGTSNWDVVTDRWSAHTARVTCIAWSEDGAHAASGGLDTNVHVWSLVKPGSRLKAANAHKDGVNGVAWVGGKIVSSGGDAAVKVWDVRLP